MFILDSHCDTPSQILRCRNVGIDNKIGHVDFPKLKLGGVDASFFALFTPIELDSKEAFCYSMKMAAALLDSISDNSDKVALALSPSEAYSNKEKGLTSIFMSMENGSPIGKSLSLLRLYYRLGVRCMTLTHNADNEIADSCAQGTKWQGLSPFGREVIDEMNRLGMIVDIAHASDKTFFDVLECSKAPIVSTHSCCRALAGHRRNMSDQMLKALADKDGVIQINFYPVFLSDEFAKILDDSGLESKSWIEQEWIKDPSNKEKRAAWDKVIEEYDALKRPTYERVVDHIDHAVKVAGIDHVGLGSDFDGIEVTPLGLENVSKIQVLFDEMRKRGYSEAQIEKIAGKNFLRVFDSVIETSSLLK